MKPSKVNLIPLSTRRAIELRQIARRWFGCLSVSVMLCAFAGAIRAHQLNIERSKLADLISQCEPTELLMERASTLTNEKQRLEETHRSLSALLPNDDLLQTLGTVAHAISSGDQSYPRLQRMRLSLNNAKPPSQADTADLSGTPHPHLNLLLVCN